MLGAAERGQVDRLGVDRADAAGRGRRRGASSRPPGAAAWRRIRRRGPVDQHRVERGLDPRRAAPATRRRSPSLSRRSWAPTPRTARWASLDQRVELVVADRTFSDAEPVEELAQVADGRVAEDPGLAVLVRPADPLGQVGDQPGELVEERLLGELHGLLEPGRDPRPLLPRRAPARAATR